LGHERDPLLTSSILQASFKCEMPRLELKSSRSFLAIKRCQRTKILKVIKLARSSKKSGRRYATIAVKLLIIKRRGQTMDEHNYKIIRHYNAILGHKRQLLMDSKNQIYGLISH